MKRTARLLIAVLSLGTVALLPRTVAFAGQTVDPSTLVPVPPAAYTCQADGVNTICREDLVFPEGPYPSGLLCGSGADPVELIGQDTAAFHGTRYFNAAGYMTSRLLHEDFEGTLTNPTNGAVATFTQKNMLHDVLAVPGDLTTVTDTSTGVNRTSVPGKGIVFQGSGRLVLDPDGTTASASGTVRNIVDYFEKGDRAVIEELCAALGAPITP